MERMKEWDRWKERTNGTCGIIRQMGQMRCNEKV